MNNQGDIVIDDRALKKFFKSLDEKELAKLERETLKECVQIIQKEARKQFDFSFRAYYKQGSAKTRSAMKKGIRVRTGRLKGTREMYGSASIMGHPLLHFLEDGNYITSPRMTKGKGKKGFGKQLNRGDIKGQHFFEKTKEVTENEVFAHVEDGIQNAVVKRFIRKEYGNVKIK